MHWPASMKTNCNRNRNCCGTGFGMHLGMLQALQHIYLNTRAWPGELEYCVVTVAVAVCLYSSRAVPRADICFPGLSHWDASTDASGTRGNILKPGTDQRSWNPVLLQLRLQFSFIWASQCVGRIFGANFMQTMVIESFGRIQGCSRNYTNTMKPEQSQGSWYPVLC